MVQFGGAGGVQQKVHLGIGDLDVRRSGRCSCGVYIIESRDYLQHFDHFNGRLCKLTIRGMEIATYFCPSEPQLLHREVWQSAVPWLTCRNNEHFGPLATIKLISYFVILPIANFPLF